MLALQGAAVANPSEQFHAVGGIVVVGAARVVVVELVVEVVVVVVVVNAGNTDVIKIVD
jgi:hypothetical protein